MAKVPFKTLFFGSYPPTAGLCCPRIVLACRTFVLGTAFNAKSSVNNQIMKRWVLKSDRYMQGTVAKLQGHSKLSKSARKKKFHAPKPMFAAFQKTKLVDADPLLVSSQHPKESIGKERRAKQLSIIIFDHVSSMLNSGQICPELVDLGFHLSKVFVPTDLGSINVHWFATGTEKDEEVAKLLNKCATEIRSELTSLHVLGAVPRVVFVRDMSRARMAEVERLLKVADMGPDFIATDFGHKLRDNNEIINQGINSENENSGQDDIEELFEERKTLVEAILKERELEQQETVMKLEQALEERSKSVERNLNQSIKELEERSIGSLDLEHEQKIRRQIAKKLEKPVVIQKPRDSVSIQGEKPGSDTTVSSYTQDGDGVCPTIAGQRNQSRAPPSEAAIEEITRLYNQVKFTYNIYDLDHMPLAEKVSLAKRRVKDRNYKRDEPTEIQRGTFSEVNDKLDLVGLSANKIRESLNKVNQKEKSSKKNLARLLDSRLHRNAEASVTSVEFLPEDQENVL